MRLSASALVTRLAANAGRAGPLAVNAVTDTAYVISGGSNTVTVISRAWI